MSGGFELQPRDGGPRVALAPGETVIGRGPLLGITDKRVSRRHAILEVVGGQLRIKPIHTSPCFYQSSEKSQLLPLKTNLWHWLNPGDSFSLFVDKYIFRVFSTYSETELDCTFRNSQMLDEDDILNEIPESSLVNLPDKTTGAPQLEGSTGIATTQTSTTNSVSFAGECSGISKQQSNPAQRKRILPAWMLTDLGDQNLPAPVTSENNVNQKSGREGFCKNKTQEYITQQGRKRLISPGSSQSTSAEQDTGKKCRNADQEESVISSKEMPQTVSAVTLSNMDVSNKKTNALRNEIPTEGLGKVSEDEIITKGTRNKEETVSCSESCSSAQGKSSHGESQGSCPGPSSDPSNPATLHAKAADPVLQGSEENKVKRTSCMYGANCYRKNPVHFQHFSHPGDNDYGGVKVMCQDLTDDRPECPYGESCYRKNPQHKIEYRHSTLPTACWLWPCPSSAFRLEDQPLPGTRCSHSPGDIIIAEPQKGSASFSLEGHTPLPPTCFGQDWCHWGWRIRNTVDDDEGQPNEYDLNDSFLDDEEEEYEPTDEDSDWEPGKEDEEKEDMEELLKEAKTFMKRKK
ncbi:aprataxin and PNK-like factor isoform X1 [Myotis myotis]|uniref:aprataxin and PNK-like factor isoform X1 n=1 Tax=Myotis myotis TaxID=51298 RepID=UPI0017497C1E|nr:aprataxin and PNK-like factor isoform X1 [Myotis myotis]